MVKEFWEVDYEKDNQGKLVSLDPYGLPVKTTSKPENYELKKDWKGTTLFCEFFDDEESAQKRIRKVWEDSRKQKKEIVSIINGFCGNVNGLHVQKHHNFVLINGVLKAIVLVYANSGWPYYTTTEMYLCVKQKNGLFKFHRLNWNQSYRAESLKWYSKMTHFLRDKYITCDLEERKRNGKFLGLELIER